MSKPYQDQADEHNPRGRIHVDPETGDVSVGTSPYSIKLTGIKLSRPAGYWVMPGSDDRCGTRLSSPKKPRWLVRQLMRLVFGFKWEDFK